MKIEDLILNRRVFLKGQLGGLATLIGLPYLESIFSNPAYAQSLQNSALRFACFYHPNGVIQSRVSGGIDGFPFFPNRTSETNFDLRSSNLIPLDDLGLKDYLTIIEGVRTPAGSGNAHMRGISGFLTGKGLANDRVQRVSKSIDQVLTDEIAKGIQSSPYYFVGNPQLDRPNNNTYNNALKNSLCFSENGSLRVPRNDFRKVFDELFAGVNQNQTQNEVSRRDVLRLSVLDSVKESRDYLNSQVNGSDRARLEEYYDRIRSAERSIDALYENQPGPQAPTCQAPNSLQGSLQNYNPSPTHNNVIHNLESITDNLIEMMAIGFACDRVRVFSYMFGGEAAGCEYRNIGVNKHFHNTLSHNNSQSNAISKQHREVDRWHVRKVGLFAKKLSEMDDGNGKSVLDNSLILSGSGLARGYNHTHDPLPIVLLGKAGGGARGGRYLRVSGNDKPTGVLLSSILRALGVQNNGIGDNGSGRSYQL